VFGLSKRYIYTFVAARTAFSRLSARLSLENVVLSAAYRLVTEGGLLSWARQTAR